MSQVRHVMFFSICVLAGSFSSFTIVHAEDSPPKSAEEEPVQQLEEYIVSDTRLPSRRADRYATPANITAITKEDIRESGAKTVQEALEKATGVVLYNQVGNEFEQRFDLRGFNGLPVPGTSVFVDGVRVNEPEFNSINFDLIPLETIERMEILPGASTIYGKNALGGVLNIVTKRGSKSRRTNAETSFGSFGRQRYQINTSGPMGKVDYFANFSREATRGFRDDSNASIWRGFGKLGFHPTATTDLAVSYTYVKDHLKQAGSLPISLADVDPEANFTPGDFVDRKNNFIRATLNQDLPFGLTFTGNGFYRKLKEESFLVSQPFIVGGTNATSRNLSDTKSWGGTFQLVQESNPFGFQNELLVGGEVRWNDFGNNLLSLSDFGPFHVRRSSDEAIAAIFAQNTLHVTPDLILTGGFRFDRNELDFTDLLMPANNGKKIFKRVTPRAGLTYFLAPHTSAYFSYSQGFRVPTTDELFAFGIFGSNPNLAPVRSNNFELGFRSQIQSWGNVTLAVFHSNVKDEIFFTCIRCDFSPGDGQNRNVKKTRRRGFEATFKVKPNKYFDGLVNYTFTEAQFRSPFNITATRVVNVGDTFPLVPKNRLSVTGTVHPMKDLSLSLSGLYVSTQFLQSDEGNTGERLPGYFTLNGRVSYERPVPGGRLSGFLNINNLLNNHYFTSGIFAANRISGGGVTDRFVVPAAGIAVFGGLSYRFESSPSS